MIDVLRRISVPLVLLLVIPLFVVFRVSMNLLLVIPFVRVYNIISAVPAHGYLISFILLMGIIIFLVGGITGFAAFQTEYRDKAFEYLLSFPMKKRQILLNKLKPRLMVLFGLCMVYEILAILYILPLIRIQGKLFFLFHPIFFPVCLGFLFLISFMVSLFEQKNWVAVVNIVILWAMITGSLGMKRIIRAIVPGVRMERYLLNGISFSLSLLVILIIVAIVFYLVYRRFDMKSATIHGHRFVVRVLPPLSIYTLAGLIIIL